MSEVSDDDMTDDDLLDELREMSNSGQLSVEQALRIIMRAQAATLRDVQNVDKRVKALELSANRYPSLTYLWGNNRQAFVMWVALIFLVGLSMYSWLIVSDLRQPIFDFVRSII